MQFNRVFLALAFVAAALPACGHDHDHDHENPNAEACAHSQAGPFEDATAVAPAMAAAAPAVDKSHTAYRLSLPAAASGFSGVVKFTPPQAGRYVFFTTAPSTLQARDAAGADRAAAQSVDSIAECTAIRGRHEVSLPAGASFVTLTSPQAMLVLVIEKI
jgi:non-ribosomal peptide synthetase component F